MVNMKNLSPEEKRAILAELLAKKAEQVPVFVPLSYMQQGLWSLYQLAPESWAYNVLFSAKILSSIDISTFQQAWQILINRHDCLRSTYPIKDSIPVRQIHPQQEFHLEEIDSSSWSEEKLEREIKEIVHRPFDLAKGPVIRVNLLRRSLDEYIFLVVIHHIAIDLWALTVLLDELRLIYEAKTTDRAIDLPPLKYQYADCTRLQAEMLEQSRGEKLQRYWQKQLGGELPVLNLPTDRPRPPRQTFVGASHTFELSEELARELRNLAKTEGASLYMVLLSALQILLYRYSSQEDILVGSAAACRNGREFARVVGPLINPIVLRGDLSGNPSFTTFLTQVKNTVLEALQHQEYPFQLAIQQIKTVPDFSRAPVFQVMFLLQKLHRADYLTEFIVPSESTTIVDFGGLAMQPFPLPHQEGQFDLMLEAIEVGKSIKFIWKYNPLLFDSTTILRAIEHFRTLLQGIVVEPQQSISQLPILSPWEREDWLSKWSISQGDYHSARLLHQLFETQVTINPQAIALVYKNQKLTYLELNRRANQLGNYLRSLGIKVESLVGIYLERSLETIIAILGILKAGAAYVPLDPSYPQERLQYIINDAEVKIVVTESQLLERLPECELTVCLDRDCQALDRQGLDNLNLEIEQENLAYIIYTSGSTGQPKGVKISHQNVTRLFAATNNWFNFSDRDVWTLFHSYAFDFSVWELWGALAYGGRLVVVPYSVSRDPEAFYRLLISEGVTILNQTPSAFYQLIRVDEMLSGSAQLNLRLVIFGGEALNFNNLKPWFDKHGDRFPQLVNMYGITETTVHVTYRPLTIADVEGTASAIGIPIPDLKIYLLDRHLQPVPIGIPGEMYVGGEGLAKGYLNRPQLTSERFITNPFMKNGSKLYKTGDLARYLNNGELEYLGRIDNQVKIRGFRIELGEIEATLSQHSEVREVLVLVREDIPQDRRLVAYIVPHTSLSNGESLRLFLEDKLPDYTIPSAFVFLEQFPLTTNGKIDRRALPSPNSNRETVAGEFIAPRNDLERQLVEIWEKVLGVQPIGIRDNFFNLGGHSLLTVRLVGEIEQTLKRKLPIATLFQLTTVERIANLLQEESVVAVTQEEKVPLVSNPNILDLPWEDYRALLTTHAHWQSPRLGSKSLILATQTGDPQQKLPIWAVGGMGDLHRYLPLEQPVYSLPVHTHIQNPSIYVRAIAACYVREILDLQPNGPYILFGYCFGGTVALEIAQQLQEQKREVGLLVLVERDSFDLLHKLYLKFLRPFVANWRQLLKLNWQERQEYAGKKFNGIVERFVSRAKPQAPCLVKAIEPEKVAGYNEDLYTESILLAQDNYHPQPYNGRMALFFSNEGARTSWLCPQGGWGNMFSGEVVVEILPGNTNGLLIEPNVKILADKLEELLGSRRRSS
jgi:amino acid adenylation domain-containing protein